jgi:proteasome lid subunit RPN8/RPN11
MECGVCLSSTGPGLSACDDGSETICLTVESFRQITEHVVAALPNEAVGLLGGPRRGLVSITIPLPNLAEPRRFFADPLAQYRAERRIGEMGYRTLAIYHSHPDGGPRLSRDDWLFARLQPGVVQVVVSIARPSDDPKIRAYQVRDGDVEEVVIDVLE